MPSVSVIIPCYNYGRFLVDAVVSVEKQTLRAKEVIVVDDGSVDDTPLVAKELGSRIRYIRTSNRGVSAARNRGAAESTGDWIAFLDADDYWLPNRMSRQWEFLSSRSEAPKGAIQCGYVVADSALRPIGTPVGVDTLSVKRALLMKPQFTLLSGTLLIDRETFFQVGAFDESLTTGADYDLGIRLLRRGLLTSLPDPLVLYRSHGSQMHLDARAFRREVDLILDRELTLQPTLVGRQSRAGAALLELNLHLADGSPAMAFRCLWRALMLWPPSLNLILRSSWRKLRPNQFANGHLPLKR